MDGYLEAASFASVPIFEKQGSEGFYGQSIAGNTDTHLEDKVGAANHKSDGFREKSVAIPIPCEADH
jgi:hypothetical protein